MPQQRASSGRTARCQPTARLWEQTVAHGLGSRPNHQAAACPGQPAPPRAPQWAPGRWPGRSGRSAPGRGRSAGGGGAALGVGAKGRDGRGRHAVGVHAASKCPCFVLQGGGGGGADWRLASPRGWPGRRGPRPRRSSARRATWREHSGHRSGSGQSTAGVACGAAARRGGQPRERRPWRSNALPGCVPGAGAASPSATASLGAAAGPLTWQSARPACSRPRSGRPGCPAARGNQAASAARGGPLPRSKHRPWHAMRAGQRSGRC